MGEHNQVKQQTGSKAQIKTLAETSYQTQT